MPRRQSTIEAFAKGAALGARLPGGIADSMRKKMIKRALQLQAKEWKAAQTTNGPIKPATVRPRAKAQK
jgi:hypothetical protein